MSYKLQILDVEIIVFQANGKDFHSCNFADLKKNLPTNNELFVKNTFVKNTLTVLFPVIKITTHLDE